MSHRIQKSWALHFIFFVYTVDYSLEIRLGLSITVQEKKEKWFSRRKKVTSSALKKCLEKHDKNDADSDMVNSNFISTSRSYSLMPSCPFSCPPSISKCRFLNFWKIIFLQEFPITRNWQQKAQIWFLNWHKTNLNFLVFSSSICWKATTVCFVSIQ